MRRGANPRVSWEKKQFHLDNAATVKLHLAFADKSTPVTEEFSTPQAICAVHWTSESQQAPRHTQGIIPFRAEGWGNHSIGWAKGLGGYASKRAKFLEWEWGGVRDPKVNWRAVISLTCDQSAENIQKTQRKDCVILTFQPFQYILWLMIDAINTAHC